MKQVDKMPEEGQFVAVWEYDNCPWSFAYKWKACGEEKVLTAYDQESDSFKECHLDGQFIARNKALYFIVEE